MWNYKNSEIKLIRELDPKDKNQMINDLRLLVHAYSDNPSEIFKRLLLPSSLIVYVVLLLSSNKLLNMVTHLYSILGITFVVILLFSLLTGLKGFSKNDMKVVLNLSVASHLLLLMIILLEDALAVKFSLLPLILAFDVSIMIAIDIIGTLVCLRSIVASLVLGTRI